MSKIIIAIDGHSSCGKSTMAKALAQQVGYIYVDSGAMYRAVTLFALRHQLFNADGSVKAEQLQSRMSEVKVHFKLDPTTNLPVTYLNEERVEDEIRTLEVSQHVSPIAALPFVREAMTAAQQAMGEEKGIVMDGRDIGTAVFPQAELKIFVTASAEVRAQRRYDELQTKGLPASYDDILKNVQERDYIDSHREVSPLRQAEDALVLDNSQLTREAQNQWLLDQFEADLEQFVTTEAGLSPQEAAVFFPVYKEMQQKQRVLFGKMRQCALSKPELRDAVLQLLCKLRECMARGGDFLGGECVLGFYFP